ncbi:MAG: hypothetical protein QM765_42240 [Myxococcales bacterium]
MRVVLITLAAAAAFASGSARAQCTKDVDCKGDRVCENGRCVDGRPRAATVRPAECRMGTDGRQACGYDCKMGTDGVVVCANTPGGVCAMGANGRVTCSATVVSPAPAAPQPTRPAPECRMGTNGVQACGYHCQMGTDGVFACANTPDGVCAMGTNGRVTCSNLGAGVEEAPRRHEHGREHEHERERVRRPAPECRMGSDGTNVCGYNCRMGSNGRFYCASTPDGQCAFNSNGTFTCP